MLIHIFEDTPHHYLSMRQFFLSQCQVNYEQQFWARVPRENNETNSDINYYKSDDDLVTQLRQLPRQAKVIFHGLFSVRVWRKLVFTRVPSKASCIMWGTELYRHKATHRTFKQKVAQLVHCLLVNRFNQVCALNLGDAKLVNQLLFRKQVSVLAYPLIGFEGHSEPIFHLKPGRKLKILVGNSAAPSNNHLKALQLLAAVEGGDFEIHMPLNYVVQEDYVVKVTNEGKRLFGDNFHPITDMLKKDAYDRLLSQMDLTVFAHDRQQGLYVVYAMLLQGKHMFLEQSTSSFQNLTEQGFEVHRLSQLPDLTQSDLSALCASPNIANHRLMGKTYTINALAPKWSVFLNGL